MKKTLYRLAALASSAVALMLAAGAAGYRR